jgi:hypothetical protein
MDALHARVYPTADTEGLTRDGFEPAGFVGAPLDSEI